MKKVQLGLFCAAFALSACGVEAQATTPIITQTVGIGSSSSYCVIDFQDSSSTPSYAFVYLYNGSPSAGDMIDALQSAGDLNFTDTDYGTAGQPDRFFDSFSIGSQTQSDAVDTVGFWQLFTSDSGQDWTPAGTGADEEPLTDGSWDAFSWDADYNDPNGDLPPVTPIAAPEPGPIGVIAGGACCIILLGLHRRRIGRKIAS
jgi:hypothetical protein